VKQVADNTVAAIHRVAFRMINRDFEACPVLSLFRV